MNETPVSAPGIGFRDRSRALAVGGWILIAVGVLCAGFVLLIAAATIFSPAAAASAAPGAMLFNILIYALVGACFVALGVGSIRARRSALALILVLLWCWLATGVLGLLFTGIVMPRVLASSETPSGAMACALIAALLFLALFFVALPLFLLLFYRREDVRRTIEARDPRPAWTDQLPPSLLGIVVALLFGVLGSVLSLFVMRAVPLFGTIVTGWPARLVVLAMCAVCAVLAVAVWRRSPAGWWGLVVFQAVSLVNVWTMRGLDMATLMRMSGYPEEQVLQAGRVNLFGGAGFMAAMVVAWVALMVFFVAVRKHFRPVSAVRIVT
jgi:hypothetical protein